MIKDIREYLGFTDRTKFTHLSGEEKSEVGQRLNNLLVKVADCALVPVMNNTLKKNDVEKLASLKGIPIDDSSRDGIPWFKVEGVKKEEDIDDLMPMADADIRARERADKDRAASSIQKTWRMHRDKAAFCRMNITCKGTVRKRPPRPGEGRPRKVRGTGGRARKLPAVVGGQQRWRLGGPLGTPLASDIKKLIEKTEEYYDDEFKIVPPWMMEVKVERIKSPVRITISSVTPLSSAYVT